MERYLRSLLVSLAGAEQTVNRGSLSELARAFSAVESPENPESVRERAGLLALLNLMGILEVFYTAGESMDSSVSGIAHSSPESTESAVPAPITTPTGELSVAAPGNGFPQMQSIAAIVAGLANQESSREPETAAHTLPDAGSGATKQDALASVLSAIPMLLGGKEGGIDPSLFAAMLKLISSMSKAKPVAATRQDSFLISEDAPEASPGTETGKSVSPDTQSHQTEIHSDTLQPSYQGSQGLDPNLISSLFNFLAGLDMSKTKAGIRHDTQAPVKAVEKTGQDRKAEITLSKDGKSILATRVPRTTQQPPSLSQFLRQPSQSAGKPVQRPSDRHKPGIGIRRGWIKQSRSGEARRVVTED